MTPSRKSPIWHPFTQHALQGEMTKIVRGEGAYLYTEDGRRIIDAIASWWVVTHGHCHPDIVSAIQKQAEQLNQIIFAGHTHEPAEEVASAILKLAPRGLDYVFFSDSGSTSVEVALKMALGYWHNIGQPRTRIVVMQHSYHGDTIGAMSVGERGVFNAAYGPLLFDVTAIPFPSAGHEQATLDALEAAVRHENPAAFIVEPLILGAGGMLMYPPWVLKEMKRICERAGVLFIADEVMTGWGRTGTLFACEQADVSPDIACYSKGLTGGSLPLAVTLCRADIFDAHFSRDRTRTFFIRVRIRPIRLRVRRPRRISICGRIRRLARVLRPLPRCRSRRSSRFAPIRDSGTFAAPVRSRRLNWRPLMADISPASARNFRLSLAPGICCCGRSVTPST
jgi:adenosylmethionine-8-amino-7-oxononanoate aminotransferase